MEKSFAVDAPGIRRVLKAGEEADEEESQDRRRADEPPLHAAGGGHRADPRRRHRRRDHLWAYREHGRSASRRKSPGMSELAHQIRNYSNFTWLNGSFLLDWLIHNLDVCCWVKDAWPVSAQGHGGRQVRTAARPVVRPLRGGIHLRRRHAAAWPKAGTWPAAGASSATSIHGAKGSAVLGEGHQPNPASTKAIAQTPENVIWQYKGPKLQSLPVRARPVVRGHPPGQALQRDRALRQGAR